MLLIIVVYTACSIPSSHPSTSSPTYTAHTYIHTYIYNIYKYMYIYINPIKPFTITPLIHSLVETLWARCIEILRNLLHSSQPTRPAVGLRLPGTEQLIRHRTITPHQKKQGRLVSYQVVECREEMELVNRYVIDIIVKASCAATTITTTISIPTQHN